MLSRAEEQEFLAPILAHPEDDGPRFILADYLNESDDPIDRARAELMTVQLLLARLPEDDPHRRDLLNAQNDLLFKHYDAWTRPYRGLASGFEFRRGILDSVTVEMSNFALRGEDLLRHLPIRRVRLLAAVPQMSLLAQTPALLEIRELDLCGTDLGNGGLNILLRSPYLGQIESLNLSFNGLCDGALDLLARSNRFASLQHLALNDNGMITAMGVARLAESPYFQGLRSLDLSGNDIGDAAAAVLAQPGVLPFLSDLKWHGNHLGDAGVVHLMNSELLTRVLRHSGSLDLKQNTLGPAGMEALAAAERMKDVVKLDLSGNYLGDDGLTLLGDSIHLGQLRKLSVRQNRITDLGAHRFSVTEVMNQLDHLDISANRLTSSGIDQLWNRRKDWQTVLECGENFATSR